MKLKAALEYDVLLDGRQPRIEENMRKYDHCVIIVTVMLIV